MRSRLYLKAMGIPVWKSRRVLPFAKPVMMKNDMSGVLQASEEVVGGLNEVPRKAASLSTLPQNTAPSGAVSSSPVSSGISPLSTSPLSQVSLNAGIDGLSDVVGDLPKELSIDSQELTFSWDEIQAKMSQCVACDLHRARSQVVLGSGNRQADWLIIGEAPNPEEDAQGEPFVGAVGRLLNNMLLAVGESRGDVFIASLVRCSTPDNRDPTSLEVSSCSAFLEQQIALIQPKVILSVGRVATQSILKSSEPIGRIRGAVYRFGSTDIPLIPIFHPAYLLRSPSEKSKVWADLILAKRALASAL